MIISKEAIVTINSITFKYFKKLGYNFNKVNDKVLVLIKDLKLTSTATIEVKCDYCDEIVNTTYAKYNLVMRHEIKKYPCSTKCNYLKRKESLFKMYGVENPIQIKGSLRKALLTSNRVKKYKDTNLYYQGTYEEDFLNNYYQKLKIENGKILNYNLNNSIKRYHSDFYIPDKNLIVEIKSKYIFELHKDINLMKEKESKNLGYNFIFIIDKNYDEFNKIISCK